MKKYGLLFLLVFTFQYATAQIVDIPDLDFKYHLTSTDCVDSDGDGIYDSDVDLNDDGEIQVVEAEAVLNLYFNGYLQDNDFYTITGIEAFINLEELRFYWQNNLVEMDLSQNISLKKIIINESPNLETIDVSQNINLEYLSISDFPNIETIDVSQNINLEYLIISDIPNIETVDVSQNLNLEGLGIHNSQITELDLTPNSNLRHLDVDDNSQLSSINLPVTDSLTAVSCDNSNITSLDLSNLTGLINLYCENNQIEDLNIENTPSLTRIFCSNNNIETIDISQNPQLVYLDCKYNAITNIDMSQNPILGKLYCSYNPLIYLNVKNGANFDYYADNAGIFIGIKFYGTPNLEFICIDENELFVEDLANNSIVVNSYCSFVPGGEFYEVSGQNTLDANANGCDMDDVIIPSLKYEITDGTNEGIIISDTEGNYFFPVSEGTYTITPNFENPEYFTVSPESITVDFPTDTSPFEQDFCIIPNGTHNDLEVSIMPINQAIPGFEAEYRIFYKNKGYQTLSGDLQFLYNDDVMNFESASQTVDVQNVGSLLWNYTDLLPFETRTIDVTMLLNTPTDSEFPLNGDDILTFESVISPSDADETPEDNVFVLDQTVVNSFDPNDKICLQGDEITEDQVGEYVHYRIRFENTGTANAVNIVVKDDIDETKYDITSLVPLHASHNYVTRINDHTVEFIFENIQLPFDDANNDGYVFFKIKTLPSLQIGDSFDNDAEIYFDFNFPIITEDAITTVVSEELSIETFEVNNLKIYPNPVSDVLHIVTEQRIESLTIYDLNGRLLQRIVSTGLNLTPSVDVSSLSQGTYFVSVKTKVAIQNYKFIKQ